MDGSAYLCVWGGGGSRGEDKVRHMCINKPSERERRKRLWVGYMRASTSG